MNPKCDLNEFRIPTIPPKDLSKVSFVPFRSLESIIWVKTSQICWKESSNTIQNRDILPFRLSATHFSTSWETKQHTQNFKRSIQIWTCSTSPPLLSEQLNKFRSWSRNGIDDCLKQWVLFFTLILIISIFNIQYGSYISYKKLLQIIYFSR